MVDPALPPILLSLRRVASAEDPQPLAQLRKGPSRLGTAQLGILTLYEPTALRILRAAGLQRQAYGICLVTPNLSHYVREVAQGGLGGAAWKNVLGAGPSALARTAVAALTRLGPLLRKDFCAMARCVCQYEICRLRSFALKAVFLHPQVTDVALALRNRRILLEFIALVKSHPRLVPGFATANYCLAEARLREWRIEDAPILTPVNPAGFGMKPNRSQCERCLKETARPIAADRIRVDEAPADPFRYLESFTAIRSAVIELADWAGETFQPRQRSAAHEAFAREPSSGRRM